MTGTLILLRHGESEWNAKNLFTGWVDVDLNAKGEAEASRGGELLVENDLLPDVVHTSVLRRAIRTAQISLDIADRLWIETKRSWRLNERHYGALQGKDKAATLAEFGEEQFMLWRRSYDIPPPPIDNDDQYANFDDPKYAGLPSEARPRTECLKDVLIRALPYWYDQIVPDLLAEKVTLIAAHGNSLRAIVKHLDKLSDEAVVGLNIPTGIPLVYELDDDLKPVGSAAATWIPRPPPPRLKPSRCRARSRRPEFLPWGSLDGWTRAFHAKRPKFARMRSWAYVSHQISGDARLIGCWGYPQPAKIFQGSGWSRTKILLWQ